jgi:hypothetical protein
MTLTTNINQKKCEHCQKWTDGNKAFCEFCGEILDFGYRKDLHELEKKWQNQSLLMDDFKIKNSDKNKFLFVIEKLVQGGQAIIIGIITLVTIVLMALPG